MVTMIYGKIASGKTTEAEKLSQKGAVLLSCDELMLTIFKECLGAKHAETEHRCLCYLFKMAKQLDDKELDSVIDAGFWTRAEREEADAFFDGFGINHQWRKIEAPDDVRAERVKARYQTQNEKSERVFAPSPERAAQLDKKFED